MNRNRYQTGLIRFPQWWYEEEKTTVTKVVHVFPDARVENSFQNLLAKHGGDADKAARELFNDNYTLRREKGDLETQLSDAKKQVPEGAVVLTDKKDVDAWEYLKTVEGGAEAIRTGLAERDTLKEETAKTAKRELLRKAAAAHKYTNTDALVELAELKGWTLEEKTERQEGKDVPVYYVKAGENGTSIRLDEYVTSHEARWLPALTAHPDGQGSTGTGSNYSRRTAPQQNRGQGSGTTSDPVTERLERRRQDAAKPNALAPNRQLATQE